MRIAIAGGGVGGLTLARVLRRRGSDAVVYEREADRSARSQGGMLDLHRESGQHALAEAVLSQALRQLPRCGKVRLALDWTIEEPQHLLVVSLVTGGRTLPASNVPSRLLDDGHRQFSKALAVLKRQLDIATDEGSMGSQKLWQGNWSR